MAVFSLAQVLSIMHPRLLCSLDEVFQILNFMTDETLFIHQVPRAGRACEPALREQFPALATDAIRAEIDAFCDTLADCGDANLRVKNWLDEKGRDWGAEFDVSALGYLESNPKCPARELGEMMSGREVMIIQDGEGE